QETLSAIERRLSRLLSDYQALKAERDEAREYGKQARIRENAAEDARISAHDRALAAEARLSAVEGALTFEAVRDALAAASCTSNDKTFVSASTRQVFEALTTITGGGNER